MWWAWLLLGIVIGANVGLFVSSACVAASDRADGAPRNNIINFRLAQLRRAKKGKNKWQA